MSLSYTDDNSFNLSYIYRFNILSDGGYFPDKSLEVYDNTYTLSGNYQVISDERKSFIKQFNMGRLNVMLDNPDYLPSEDQVTSCNKVRECFDYLGAIPIQPNKWV